jgi:uncharacterized membrane protein YgcG
MIMTIWLRTRLLLLAYALLMHGMACAKPSEYIALFDSHIQINQDASLKVTETIVVQAAGIDIKRGIYRSFPTRYGSSYSHFVSFNVESVRCQGKEAPYRIEKAMNGIHLYIGDPNSYLRPGRYTYEIVYRASRQLGMFNDHDELYWNVTGQAWTFPIERVTARVDLPQRVPADQLKAAAYWGYSGSQNESSVDQDITDGSVTFKLNESLRNYQGLTIVVGWPKGIITGPGLLERLKWAILDIYTLLILYAICMIALLIYMFHKLDRENKSGTIIPLFYPPKDWTPGMVRGLLQHGYDQQAFAADIVDWAVKGFITINYNKGIYTISRTSKQCDMPIIYELFGSSQEVVLGESYNDKVEKAFNNLKWRSSERLNNYFDGCYAKKSTYSAVAIGLAVLISVVDVSYYEFSFALITFGICIAGIMAALYFFKGYTPQGRIKRDEIEGFELFLSTTEKERMNMVGTPPTMTPSLYETYLPYAMALGVEERWTAQFTPIFERMQKETGVVYVPRWYHGRSGFYSYNRMTHSLSSNLGNSLKSVISSSSTPPGSSSGFGGGGRGGGGGGGGSAGGGGGGGGGGGW